MTRAQPLAFALPLALFVIVLSLAPRDARACSCVPPPPPATALERSAQVFVAEVVAVTPRSELRKEVKVRVERAFKGAKPGELTLVTPSNSAACGRNFEVGKRYLVYAEELDGALYDHLCTRTSLLEHAKHDVEALEALARGETPPAEPEPAVEEKDGEGTPPSGAAGDDGDKPALDEGPAPSRSKTPREDRPEQPGGHCAAVDAVSALPFSALLLGLLLVRASASRRRR